MRYREDLVKDEIHAAAVAHPGRWKGRNSLLSSTSQKVPFSQLGKTVRLL